jgi:hypothetical protein
MSDDPISSPTLAWTVATRTIAEPTPLAASRTGAAGRGAGRPGGPDLRSRKRPDPPAGDRRDRAVMTPFHLPIFDPSYGQAYVGRTLQDAEQAWENASLLGGDFDMSLEILMAQL